MKNKKGFTLIELLAVIIILGILMIIAIPSVTKYISDSRKNSYVDTAKEIIAGTRNVVNEGKLGMYDTNTTYYIPSSYIKTENASKSPYGDFVQAYVVVTYDGTGYKYYWTSVDDAGQGVKDIISYNELDTDNIESDLNPDMVDPTKTKVGIGNRTEIKVLDENGNWKHEIHLDNTNNNVPEEGVNSIVVYPAGKTKETVVTGDIVKIGTEEFYVVKHDGNDLILLAKYNLKVGYIFRNDLTFIREYTSSDDGYGKQNSEMKGWTENDEYYYGTMSFAGEPYWKEYLGTSEYPGYGCGVHSGSSTTYVAGSGCTYVYNSNSENYIYPYVNDYKTYLESLGANIKEARLLNIDEAYYLGATIDNYYGAPEWFYSTTYWLGSLDSYGGNLPTNHSDYPLRYEWVYAVDNFHGEMLSFWHGMYEYHGIRPVIVI